MFSNIRHRIMKQFTVCPGTGKITGLDIGKMNNNLNIIFLKQYLNVNYISMIKRSLNPINIIVLIFTACLLGCSDKGVNDSGNNTGTLNDGLVAYFPLDSNYTDASGNDNSLQAYGNPQFTEGYRGESSAAVLLDGKDDYLVGTIGKLDTFSISLWVQSYTTFVGEWPQWRSTCFDYSDKQVYSYIDATTGATQLHCGIESVPVADAYIAVGSNVWSHIYIAASNELKIYIDGELGATEALQDAIVYSSDSIFFGRASSDDNIELTYLDGKLDEIRIYNRILNQDEIGQLAGNDSH